MTLHLKISEDGSLGTTLFQEYVVVIGGKVFVVSEVVYATNPHDDEDLIADVTVKTAEEAMSSQSLPDHILKAIEKKMT